MYTISTWLVTFICYALLFCASAAPLAEEKEENLEDNTIEGQARKDSGTTPANPIISGLQNLLNQGSKLDVGATAIMGSFQAMVFPVPKFNNIIGGGSPIANLLQLPQG